ncbi:TetR family transcriptional regulator [Clostridium sp. MCC353]|uniref:TetR/AcrR family transcriptional regulator n=1 Tax=Clostridium sp. MCC353 TaxID=2592646 RepID=UPI001C00EE83|nr:TetR/AcrR family transcriptional regulator [Clostridium sp. MCC353]MBT9776642.1 TetR family transcriptional regulator [Clostridium sp. MCC353]
MARRKQEPALAHRGYMMAAAKKLFEQKGIERTTMDEIAAAAGYSKATLYVYFENKDEIIGCMILESMSVLCGRLRAAAGTDTGVIQRYFDICHALAGFREEFPMQFDLILQRIRIDVEKEGTPQVFAEIFEMGEQLNRVIGGFLEEGMALGQFDRDLKIPETVFILWSGLSGIIQMADQKKEYIETVLGCGKQEFLEYGFTLMLRPLWAKGESNGWRSDGILKKD